MAKVTLPSDRVQSVLWVIYSTKIVDFISRCLFMLIIERNVRKTVSLAVLYLFWQATLEK